MCFFLGLPAYFVSRHLLPVKRLGHIQDPRSLVNGEETLWGLIGTRPTDLVGYRHLFTFAWLKLKKERHKYFCQGHCWLLDEIINKVNLPENVINIIWFNWSDLLTLTINFGYGPLSFSGKWIAGITHSLFTRFQPPDTGGNSMEGSLFCPKHDLIYKVSLKKSPFQWSVQLPANSPLDICHSVFHYLSSLDGFLLQSGGQNTGDYRYK